jgi:hypothetical protein
MFGMRGLKTLIIEYKKFVTISLNVNRNKITSIHIINVIRLMWSNVLKNCFNMVKINFLEIS